MPSLSFIISLPVDAARSSPAAVVECCKNCIKRKECPDINEETNSIKKMYKYHIRSYCVNFFPMPVFLIDDKEDIMNLESSPSR